MESELRLAHCRNTEDTTVDNSLSLSVCSISKPLFKINCKSILQCIFLSYSVSSYDEYLYLAHIMQAVSGQLLTKPIASYTTCKYTVCGVCTVPSQ